MARLNIAKSRVRPSTCSLVGIDHVLWPERRLCPDQLAVVPRHALGCGWVCIFVILYGQTPQLLRMTIMRDRSKVLNSRQLSNNLQYRMPSDASGVGSD